MSFIEKLKRNILDLCSAIKNNSVIVAFSFILTSFLIFSVNFNLSRIKVKSTFVELTSGLEPVLALMVLISAFLLPLQFNLRYRSNPANKVKGLSIMLIINSIFSFTILFNNMFERGAFILQLFVTILLYFWILSLISSNSNMVIPKKKDDDSNTKTKETRIVKKIDRDRSFYSKLLDAVRMWTPHILLGTIVLILLVNSNFENIVKLESKNIFGYISVYNVITIIVITILITATYLFKEGRTRDYYLGVLIVCSGLVFSQFNIDENYKELRTRLDSSKDNDNLMFDGRDGANGTDGQDGIDGKDGEKGSKGADGTDGEKGKDGKNGEKGRDGNPGLNRFFYLEITRLFESIEKHLKIAEQCEGSDTLKELIYELYRNFDSFVKEEKDVNNNFRITINRLSVKNEILIKKVGDLKFENNQLILNNNSFKSKVDILLSKLSDADDQNRSLLDSIQILRDEIMKRDTLIIVYNERLKVCEPLKDVPEKLDENIRISKGLQSTVGIINATVSEIRDTTKLVSNNIRKVDSTSTKNNKHLTDVKDSLSGLIITSDESFDSIKVSLTQNDKIIRVADSIKDTVDKDIRVDRHTDSVVVSNSVKLSNIVDTLKVHSIEFAKLKDSSSVIRNDIDILDRKVVSGFDTTFKYQDSIIGTAQTILDSTNKVLKVVDTLVVDVSNGFDSTYKMLDTITLTASEILDSSTEVLKGIEVIVDSLGNLLLDLDSLKDDVREVDSLLGIYLDSVPDKKPIKRKFFDWSFNLSNGLGVIEANNKLKLRRVLLDLLAPIADVEKATIITSPDFENGSIQMNLVDNFKTDIDNAIKTGKLKDGDKLLIFGFSDPTQYKDANNGSNIELSLKRAQTTKEIFDEYLKTKGIKVLSCSIGGGVYKARFKGEKKHCRRVLIVKANEYQLKLFK